MTQHLLRLIGDRAPRYTSYPTVPQFHDGVGTEAFGRWLGEIPADMPLSLYVHVPFCRSMCWYCACNKKLATRDGPVLQYAATLAREIAQAARALPGRMRATRLHFGGGTPHSLPPEGFEAAMSALRTAFDLSGMEEAAVEIDPRTFTADWAPRLAAAGFTRASLGVQEFCPEVQRAINRVQPFEQVADCVDRLRAEGIGQINFDLMYGLPHQTTATLLASIERAVSLLPDRIALFGYAHVPWVASVQKKIPYDALPGAEERIEQAHAAADLLVRLGYVRIGLDHFALPHDSLVTAQAGGRLRRNFQGYTDDPCPAILGFGASAISALPQGYAQNVTETGAWARQVEAGAHPVARGIALGAEDRLRRRVIERIMCDLEVDLAGEAFAAGEAPDMFGAETAALAPLAEAGLVEMTGSRLRVTEPGRTALRSIASLFDPAFQAHMAAQGAGKGAAPRHAQAV